MHELALFSISQCPNEQQLRRDMDPECGQPIKQGDKKVTTHSRRGGKERKRRGSKETDYKGRQREEGKGIHDMCIKAAITPFG